MEEVSKNISVGKILGIALLVGVIGVAAWFLMKRAGETPGNIVSGVGAGASSTVAGVGAASVGVITGVAGTLPTITHNISQAIGNLNPFQNWPKRR